MKRNIKNFQGVFDKPFGTLYKTRDGRKAVLVNTLDVIEHNSQLYVQEMGIDSFGLYLYTPEGRCLDGKPKLDIIGLFENKSSEQEQTLKLVNEVKFSIFTLEQILSVKDNAFLNKYLVLIREKCNVIYEKIKKL